MNGDSTFYIGKDHLICEDYALAYADEHIGYAIISDGCSASPNVDFGSRAIAMSAENILRTNINPTDLGNEIIQNARKVFDIFPLLHPQTLDATLVMAWVKDKKITCHIYGDGVVVHKTNDGIKTVHVQLTSGAPDYLAYRLSPSRMAAYKALVDNKKNVITESCKNGDDFTFLLGDLVSYNPLEPVVLTWDAQDGDIVAVISDGINSFRKANGEPITCSSLIGEFLGFKTLEGEFVTRRISAFKRKCAKEGITHFDDISMAAIRI
jgi:hypothetical protein